jgi:uncharacterized protein (DUF58 family)
MSGASLRFNAYVLIVAAALLAIVGDWQPSFAGLWQLPAILLCAGLAYESWIATKSRPIIEVEAPAVLYLGRGTAVQFVCRHTLKRALVIEFAPGAPAFFDIESSIESIRVRTGERAAIERLVTAKRLGPWQWPVLRSRVAGALGFAWWPKQVACGGVGRVLPDLFRTADEVKGAATGRMSANIDVGGGAEVVRLRDYRAGDPPRMVDWKATARADRLISREFAQDDGLQIVILVDAGRSSALRAGALDRFGHYVNIAARLAQFAAQRDDSVGLMVYADRPLAALPAARGSNALARLRAMLASAKIERTESNPLYAAMRVGSLVRHRSLVVMLTDIDDASAESQLAHAVRFLLPKHLPFVAGLSSAEAERMAGAPARSWLDPYRSLAAQEYCIGLQRKVRALNALGAPTLVAKPEQLERAVFAAYANFRHRRSA